MYPRCSRVCLSLWTPLGLEIPRQSVVEVEDVVVDADDDPFGGLGWLRGVLNS